MIPDSETAVLREGSQASSRPVLMVLVSGVPYPSASDISWWFNDRQSLPSGIREDGRELLLPGNIGSEIAGVYTCHVTTSAGSNSANITVSLMCKSIPTSTSQELYVRLHHEITLFFPDQPSVFLSPIGTHYVKVNSSVRLTCEDSQGVPPPTFMWIHNYSNLITGIDFFNRCYACDITLSLSLSLSLCD